MKIQEYTTINDQKEQKKFLNAVYAFRKMFIQALSKAGIFYKLQEEFISAIKDPQRFMYANFLESYGISPQELQINISGNIPMNVVSNKMEDVYNHFSNLWISILSNLWNDSALQNVFEYESLDEINYIKLYLHDKSSDEINKIFISAFPVMDISRAWVANAGFVKSTDEEICRSVGYCYRIYFT